MTLPDKAAKEAAYQFSKICTEGCCRSAEAQNGFTAGAQWRLTQIWKETAREFGFNGKGGLGDGAATQRLAEEISRLREELAIAYQLIETPCEKEIVQALIDTKEENTRLQKILAQEVSENDELGAEYALVNALREDLRVALLDRALAQKQVFRLREALFNIDEELDLDAIAGGL